jgi:rhodanese-related sulfurtransferase
MKRKIQSILLLFFMALLTFSCGKSSVDNSSLVSPQELSEVQDEILLIDVRTPQEYQQGHIENSKNINIAGDSFKEEIQKLDKSQPVYVYCKVGGRSARATSMMKEMGFEEVYDLEGGIRNWESSGMEVVK